MYVRYPVTIGPELVMHNAGREHLSTHQRHAGTNRVTRPCSETHATPVQNSTATGEVGCQSVYLSDLDDPAGHGAHIGAPVPSDLSLVPDPAHRDPLEGALQHFGDGAGQAGLACPWGSHKAKNGGSSTRPLQAPHCQVLHYAIFHLQACSCQQHFKIKCNYCLSPCSAPAPTKRNYAGWLAT